MPGFFKKKQKTLSTLKLETLAVQRDAMREGGGVSEGVNYPYAQAYAVSHMQRSIMLILQSPALQRTSYVNQVNEEQVPSNSDTSVHRESLCRWSAGQQESSD